MSHIVKAKINVLYQDKEVLEIAMSHVGVVRKNATISVALGGRQYRDSTSKYPLVLENPNNPMHRIGMREAGDRLEAFYDPFERDFRYWANQALSQLDDRYIAHHYEKQLHDEGCWDLEITAMDDGSLNLVATEGGF